ncbi:hypothetical protein THMIRHAM_15330 [Thiomicrorhabdus immobilis]|uniref:diguanylate cyclase n=1 Tax=Thiomicrorhabdus immobilis TaxID=2791037 RepID=A0ABM7ME93_9GAMM|nr:GGDEF domain-containing protein [Thiomicrorhabdus immobilis]BCN93748.1 hypothetical protein THMIRHAM_15330 [Thiomicrorhabdus immobilis]
MSIKKGKSTQRALLVLLTLAMFITIATAFAIYYHLERYAKVTDKMYKVQSLANKIVYFDEALTMSARMYAYEKDLQWYSRYQSLVIQLDHALNQASHEASSIHDLIEKNEPLNQKLISIEERSFADVRNNRLQQAQQTLKSPEYQALKQRYTNLVILTFQDIHNQLQEQQNNHRDWYQTFLWVLGLQVLGFVLVWFYLVNFLRLNVSRLSNLITTDDLTGLGNRRSFDDILQRELRRSIRDGKMLMLAVIDIDYFKKYNDYYGHPKGDQVLTMFGKLIEQTLRRANEFGFRIGGEEFAVIASVDSVEDGTASIEYLMLKLHKKQMEHKGNAETGQVTMSAGIAFHHADEIMTDEELYSAADKALYVAKERGRNQWVQYIDDKS